MKEEEGLKWVQSKFDNAGSASPYSRFFRLLKKNLSLLGHWKNKPRGNAKKGYQAMKRKIRN